jgi:hypothetical protein
VGNLSDTIAALIWITIPVAIVLLCAAMYRKIRRGSGSATILFGATYNLHDMDKQEAIEIVVEKEAGKKMEEESGEPE